MSRIGKKTVPVPDGVTATVDGQQIMVKGPKGELSAVLVDEVIAKLEDGEIKVGPRDETKRAHAMWGMSRTVVSNLIEGVSDGFTNAHVQRDLGDTRHFHLVLQSELFLDLTGQLVLVLFL